MKTSTLDSLDSLESVDSPESPENHDPATDPGTLEQPASSRLRVLGSLAVLLALLANPEDYTARRFLPGTDPITLRGSDVIEFSPVFPGLRITVDELFAMLRWRS